MECEPDVLLSFARDCFKSTKLFAEKLGGYNVSVPDTLEEEIQTLSRVAVANGASLLAVQRLVVQQRLGDGAVAMDVVLDFGLHPAFPVIRLAPRKKRK